jgi:hypothetical protein
MIFAALILAAFCGRLFRGCLKYAVIAALLIYVAHRDPELAHKCWQLFDEAMRELREWIVNL